MYACLYYAVDLYSRYNFEMSNTLFIQIFCGGGCKDIFSWPVLPAVFMLTIKLKA